jgi:glycosyltransferase involved in cell wall biosynthesis
MESTMVGTKSAPAVSVVMPVYDPPLEMLAAAIESILCQTFEDFEFLILDDGSQDQQTRFYLDLSATRDPRVRVFHEPHRGVPATSNRGLAMARGAYIACQDSDDWSEPNRLARQAAFLDQHPEIALAGTDTCSHSSDGQALWRLRLPHTSAELALALGEGNPFVHGSTMFRRKTALKIGGYREEFPCSSDYDFLWRLAEAGGAVNLDEVLYHYRYRGGAISAQRPADQAKVERAVRTLAGARQRGEPENILAALQAAGDQTSSIAFEASLKQADHLMLAGDFSGARKAYLGLLRSHPSSGLAWAKMFRLAVFAAIPKARAATFR